MKKKIGIALAVIGGVAVVGAVGVAAFRWFSDKMFRECFIGESDFDMLGY